MPRRPRSMDPDSIYHIVIRGNNREPIFTSDYDRRGYLSLLADAKDRLKCSWYAYALMTNHVHLLGRSESEATLSTVMQVITSTYAQRFNRRHGRVGHVFQGRFYSSRINSDAYLLEAVRYVHLNPVRAGMVGGPSAYPWSSHLFYLSHHAASIDLVDTSLVLKYFCDANGNIAPASFHNFVLEGLRHPVSVADLWQPLKLLKTFPQGSVPPSSFPQGSVPYWEDQVNLKDHDRY